MSYTLGKEEKLKRKKQIELLFAEGSHVKSYPFRMIFLQVDHKSESLLKVGFSVPKRAVKLAVDRIRIKRLMREVYRTNKQLFSKNLKEPYIAMFIYMTKDEKDYIELESTMKKVSAKFLTKINENEKKH